MAPKLSIIVPVYKAEKFIQQCIDSILKQSFTDFELILINDGSPDNSGVILDQYLNKDSRVKVIHKNNEGPSATRNMGIKAAKGEFIGFVDSDDTLEINMLDKMYKTGVSSNADIVACGYVEIDDSNKIINQAISPLNSKLYLEGNNIKEELELLLKSNKTLGYASLCNKIYKRTFLIENQLLLNETIKIAEDLCFNITAFLKAERVCSINEGLYNYRRINTESIMNSKDKNFYLHLSARNEILNTLKNNGIAPKVLMKTRRYENCKTIADYLNQIIDITKSKTSISKKYLMIKEIIHEEYFLKAMNDYDNNYLLMKARVIVNVLKIYLYITLMAKKLTKT